MTVKEDYVVRNVEEQIWLPNEKSNFHFMSIFMHLSVHPSIHPYRETHTRKLVGILVQLKTCHIY